MDYSTLENLDDWLVEANKALQRLTQCIKEIEKIRSEQESKVREKTLAVEEEKKRQFQEAYFFNSGRRYQ
jgi:hypothetical protein